MAKFFGILLGIAICGFCFNYNLDTYFGKNIHWGFDCVAGVITSPINVPAAVVGFVLDCSDVQTPIFGG